MEKPKDKPLTNSISPWVYLQLTAGYCMAIGIWGIALNKSLQLSAFAGIVVAGIVVGLLIWLSNIQVITSQRTIERVNEIMNSIGALWVSFSIIIGLIGLLVLGVRLLFFL